MQQNFSYAFFAVCPRDRNFIIKLVTDLQLSLTFEAARFVLYNVLIAALVNEIRLWLFWLNYPFRKFFGT